MNRTRQLTGHNLDPIHRSAPDAIRGRARNGRQRESIGIDREHDIVAVGVVGLSERAAEDAVRRIRQADACGGDPRTADLIHPRATGRSIAPIRVDVNGVAR
jgi:hypothetical protein